MLKRLGTSPEMKSRMQKLVRKRGIQACQKASRLSSLAAAKPRISWGPPRASKARRLTITLGAVRIRPSFNHSQYWLADIEMSIPCLIDCDGTHLRPKMILKIYCKVPKAQLDGHYESVARTRRLKKLHPIAIPA